MVWLQKVAIFVANHLASLIGWTSDVPLTDDVLHPVGDLAERTALTPGDGLKYIIQELDANVAFWGQNCL